MEEHPKCDHFFFRLREALKLEIDMGYGKYDLIDSTRDLMDSMKSDSFFDGSHEHLFSLTRLEPPEIFIPSREFRFDPDPVVLCPCEDEYLDTVRRTQRHTKAVDVILTERAKSGRKNASLRAQRHMPQRMTRDRRCLKRQLYGQTNKRMR